MRRTRPCLIECVPAACSYPRYEGSTAVTHVSCHRVTRRSALTELSPLITALSRGSEVTLQGHRGVPAGGDDSSLTLRLVREVAADVKLSGTVVTPRPTTAGA